MEVVSAKEVCVEAFNSTVCEESQIEFFRRFKIVDVSDQNHNRSMELASY